MCEYIHTYIHTYRWAETYPDRVKVYYTLTGKSVGEEWPLGKGRINQSMVHDHIPAPSEDTYIGLCGPHAFVHNHVSNLYVCVYIYLYTYIYFPSEDTYIGLCGPHAFVHNHVSNLYIYIYIYIYMYTYSRT